MDRSIKKEAKKNPRQGANLFSIISFAWLWKFFKIGYERELFQKDLFSPLDSHASQLIGDNLEKEWQQETNKCKRQNSQLKPKLWKILGKCFATEIFVIGLLQFILEFILTLPQPIVLGKLLKYFNGNDDMTKTEACYWTVVFAVIYILKVPFFHLSVHTAFHLGMKMRVSCCSLIYRKVLKISKTSEICVKDGKVMNLLTNDVNNFDELFSFGHYIWMSPFILILIAYIIYMEIEFPALTGIGLYVLIIPLQGFIGKFVPKVTTKFASENDKRLNLMNMIIDGVQSIKMYAWEKLFSQLVEKARQKEINALKKSFLFEVVAMSFETYASKLCIYLTIITYALLGNPIIAEKVFMIAAFYNNLRYSMSVAFPLGVQRFAKAFASVKRIEDFMTLEEIPEYLQGTIDCNNHVNTILDVNPNNLLETTSDNNKNSLFSTTNDSQHAVIVRNVTAKWSQESDDCNLKNINFTTNHGALTAVLGKVGSGKTSLFQIILQELAPISGNLHISGKVAYVSQRPWIFSSSIRQNILFGKTMNKKRYDEVIKVCQLEADLDDFPHKDQTMVGSKGIKLSGGQKARINLARAVYAEADIYLLDDPLSAVDISVGRSIFEECICNYLKEKARILITNQLQFLNSTDQVYVLNKGVVQGFGTFQELKKSGIDFLSMLQVSDDVKEDKLQKDLSTIKDITSESEIEEFAENRAFGKISQNVYWGYFKAVDSMWFLMLSFAVFVAFQLIGSAGDIILAKWVDAENVFSAQRNETESVFEMKQRQWYIYVYSVLIALTIIFMYIKSFLYFTMCLKSAKNLHNNMFNNIIRSTMTFFHTNPSGRINNRFSKDIGVVDNDMPFSLIDVLEVFSLLLIVIVMIFIINLWMTIPTIITGIVFYFLKIIYIKASTSIKRLEGITRSPVIDHLGDTLQGLTTIRAFKAQQILTKEFDNHQDVHSASYFLFFSCSRAFGYYLELISAFYLAIVIFAFFLLPENESIGNVGLIITQTITLATFLEWGMVQFTKVENQMTSVERILEYTNVKREFSLESTPENKPPENWPIKGCVEFRNVSLNYSKGDLVLKNLSFVIQPAEMIGIVGRTGAGKSSIINALFRLADTNGEIFIDGVAISKLGLHDLRSKISVIPQEPFLFAGTLRENLDPFQEFTDFELWETLEEMELTKTISDSGLNKEVFDKGSNFSAGEKQLICLARAMLKKEKLLVLDEATSNVDPQTDALVQKIIRKRFKQCTVFIIAHRLNTVMDCDKIMVLDKGQLKEFNHPHLLLQNNEGFLFKMVQQTGPAMENVLSTMAEESYNKYYSQ